MLFALLKKLQNYAIFMLKVIHIMPHYAHICCYIIYDGSVQNKAMEKIKLILRS